MQNGDKYIEMNEYYLVSQGEYCLLENYEPKLNRTEPSFMNLNKAFIHLKTVFAKLANDAYDLPTFYLAIDLISSLILMFTIEMEEVMSIIPDVDNKDKLAITGRMICFESIIVILLELLLTSKNNDNHVDV